jgi:hypothetical protein
MRPLDGHARGQLLQSPAVLHEIDSTRQTERPVDLGCGYGCPGGLCGQIPNGLQERQPSRIVLVRREILEPALLQLDVEVLLRKDRDGSYVVRTTEIGQGHQLSLLLRLIHHQVLTWSVYAYSTRLVIGRRNLVGGQIAEASGA